MMICIILITVWADHVRPLSGSALLVQNETTGNRYATITWAGVIRRHCNVGGAGSQELLATRCIARTWPAVGYTTSSNEFIINSQRPCLNPIMYTYLINLQRVSIIKTLI